MDLITKTERIPRVGETVWSGKFKMAPGGKGMNQAIGASRLGSDVSFIGKVGEDYFGEKLLEKLKEEEIDTTHLDIEKQVPTGTASIIVDLEGRNIIAVAPGADESITKKDIDKSIKLLERSEVFLAQLETPIEIVEYGITKAKESGAKTILNPAPAKELPKNLLKNVDVLVPNEIEVIDIAKTHEKKSMEEAARKIIQRGPETVVVTLGKEGCLIVTEEKVREIEGINVEAKDTTGAGDAFCAGLAVGLASGKDIQEAAEMGNLAGAFSTMEVGAQEVLPSLADLEDFRRKKLSK